MASGQPKVVFLTGAPGYKSLKWDSDTLLDELDPCISQLVRSESGYVVKRRASSAHALSSSSNPLPWRKIHLDPNKNFSSSFPNTLKNNRSFTEPNGRAELSFLTILSTSSTEDESTTVSISAQVEETERLENSFSLQDSFESDRGTAVDSFTTAVTFDSASHSTGLPISTSASDSYGSFPSFDNSKENIGILNQSVKLTASNHRTGGHKGIPITTLSNLPPLTEITALLPHSPPRVALLAAVTSLCKRKVQIYPRQSYQSRKKAIEDDKAETMVRKVLDVSLADDTLPPNASHLLTTLWSPFSALQPTTRRTNPSYRVPKKLTSSRLKDDAELDLRVGDIVIFYPVALHAFRGRVFAQSINPSMAARSDGLSSRVEVLARGGARVFGAGVSFNIAGMTERLKSVRSWAERRVAPDMSNGIGRKSEDSRAVEERSEALPDDSMAWSR